TRPALDADVKPAEVCGFIQPVETDHGVVSVHEEVPNEVRANEARSTGHQNPCHSVFTSGRGTMKRPQYPIARHLRIISSAKFQENTISASGLRLLSSVVRTIGTNIPGVKRPTLSGLSSSTNSTSRWSSSQAHIRVVSFAGAP